MNLLRVREVRFLVALALLDLARDEILHKVRPLSHEIRQRPFLPREPLRVIQRAFLDEPSHRIQVRRRDLAAQPHRLQRDRTPARKRVQHLGRVAAVKVFDGRAQRVHLRCILIAPHQDAAFHHFLFLGNRVALFVFRRDDAFHHRPADHVEQFLPLVRVARIRQ